jgi:molecular chaperone DnaK (HSP70)
MRPVVEHLPGEATPPAEPLSPLGDIAGIYVVGGASALPAVTRALRERFGRRVHRSPYPFAATGIGLAIAGDPRARFELSDRFSRHFGVFREERDGREVTFDRKAALSATTVSLGRGSPNQVVARMDCIVTTIAVQYRRTRRRTSP